MMHRSRRAFTLLEMTMVLAIVGLITGGILLGKNMVHNAQLNSILSDMQGFFAAERQFKDKYGYLPGDFPMAVRVWGRADGGSDLTSNCAAPATDHANIRGTCNGDGDGLITWQNSENFRSWQQMSLAGLITGTYVGYSNATTVSNYTLPGWDSPKPLLKGAAYFMYSWGDQTTASGWYPGNYNNVIEVGAVTTDWPGAVLFKPAEAYAMDKKTDDGMPGLGNIRTYAVEGGCSQVSYNPDTDTYLKNATAPGCFLIFMSGYGAPTQSQ